MVPKILLLGPTGNIGSRLVEILNRKPWPIELAHRPSFSLEDPISIRTYLPGVKRLFLLTPPTPQMVEQTKILVEEASNFGIEKIVKISAFKSVRIQMPYSHWHHQAEQILRDSQIPYVILRSNAFMQNFIQFLGPMLQKTRGLYLPAEEARVSFIDAFDIATASALALTDDRFTNCEWELTGPESLSFGEVATSLSKILGMPISYQSIPETALRNRLRSRDLPEWQIEAQIKLYEHYRSGEAAEISNTFEKICGRKGNTFSQYLNREKELFDALFQIPNPLPMEERTQGRREPHQSTS